MFSIIIPTLNEEKFLPLLLDSLVAQSQKNFEVIVVDGKSKDKTIEGAYRYHRLLPSLTVIEGDKRRVSAQRNKGVDSAIGQWLIFLDADTIVFPYFIERIHTYISTHNPSIFTSWFSPDLDTQTDALNTLFVNIYIEGSILVHRPISPGAMTVIRQDIFHKIGGFNESITFGEDFDLTRKAVRHGYKFSILRETLHIYSLRRVRREGKLKFLQTYVKATIFALINKNGLQSMHGYSMGGHLYSTKKKIKKSFLKIYESKLRSLIRDFFD